MHEERDLLHRRKIFFVLSKTLPHSIAISYENMPEHLKEQQLAKAIKQATRFLEKQGLSVA
ncbi:hypothetical protein L0O83_16530 [Lawsonibacter sp. DFI.5.51]|nr:hypothetical protein [Lawsonibacter sp. DFI.5.51]